MNIVSCAFLQADERRDGAAAGSEVIRAPGQPAPGNNASTAPATEPAGMRLIHFFHPRAGSTGLQGAAVYANPWRPTFVESCGVSLQTVVLICRFAA